MAKFRLSSTDLYSPIHSDISLNDVSRFSFGSLPSTPGCDERIKSPNYKHIIKGFGPAGEAMKKTETELDIIVNDFDKASNINARKEERYKESYDSLKQSMDELLCKRTFSSSIVSPISSEIEENSIQLGTLEPKINAAKLAKNSQNVKQPKRNKNPEGGNLKVSSKKAEDTKKESLGLVREKKSSTQTKSSCPSKASVPVKEKKSSTETKNSCSSKVSAIKKSKNVHLQNDAKASQSHRKSKEVSAASTKTDETVEAKQLPSSTCTSRENSVAKPKEQRTVRDFQFKSQQKICVTEPSKPATKNKDLSIEKAIQVAVGLQMDNIRNFIMDQNLNMRKELIKLQETAKQQAEVTGYLFSVVDELIETNRKLILKHK